jgi:hypothetical protein
MASFEMYDVFKAGYAFKEARKSKRNWKKRYFVLHSSALVYYENHTKLNNAKGDLMLTSESTTETSNEEGKPRLIVHSSFTTGLTIEFETFDERDEWRDAIDKVINNVVDLLRGYIIKQGGLLSGGHKRFFFVLHKNNITMHKTHETTADVIENFTLNANSNIVAKDSDFLLELSNDKGVRQRWNLKYDVSGVEYETWKVKVMNIIQDCKDQFARNKRDRAFIESTKDLDDSYQAQLTPCRSDDMPMYSEPVLGVLRPHTDENLSHYKCLLIFLMKDDLVDNGDKYLFEMTLTKYSAVCDTSSQFGFLLVTPDHVIRLNAETEASKEEWMTYIQATIHRLEADPNDSLVVTSTELGKEDAYAILKFDTKAPLGIALERIGDWAIIQMSDQGRLQNGDILHSVNGELTLLEEYDLTMSKFDDWNPPLEICFRRLPGKKGYVVKKSMTSDSKWRTRYFVLEGGKLSYRRNEEDDIHVKGIVDLYGSSITLALPTEADGRFFCVKVTNQDKSLLLQAESEKEQMLWAAALHHSAMLLNSHALMALEAKSNIQKSLARISVNGRFDMVDKATLEVQAAEAEEEVMIMAADLVHEELAEDLAAKSESLIVRNGIDGAKVRFSHLSISENYLSPEAQTHMSQLSIPSIDEIDDEMEVKTVEQMQEDAFATIQDLKIIFESYSKIIRRQTVRRRPGVKPVIGENPRLMNPMGFSALYRLASGERGNLFKELQLFHGFDIANVGTLDEEAFIKGWNRLQVTEDPTILRALRKLKKLVRRQIKVV